MTITLELRKGIYYLRENDKALITLHYGRSGHESPEDHAKRLNVNINPQVWGATKRITEIKKGSAGQLYIALDDKNAEEVSE